jgi:hypothetical protein
LNFLAPNILVLALAPGTIPMQTSGEVIALSTLCALPANANLLWTCKLLPTEWVVLTCGETSAPSLKTEHASLTQEISLLHLLTHQQLQIFSFTMVETIA